MDNPNDSEWQSPSHLTTLVLIGATLLSAYVCYRIAAPFLPAITGALALAVLFAPLQVWLEAKLKHPSLAALAAVVLIALIVVVPITFVAQRLVVQAAQGAELIEAKVASGEWRQVFAAQPRVAPLVEVVERQIDLPETVKNLTAWLSTKAASVAKDSVFLIVGLCLTFYLLFFFLRDRVVALRSVRSLSPLSPARMDKLFGRIHDTIYATVYGTLAVSAAQGLLGGLMFWWLGLPAPLLWGVVMALLAVVPVLGAFVIWLPAALFLLVEGNWGKAVILVAWGMLVVGTIDNLLRPILVGNRLKLHTVLVFLSVVGGLVLFGPAGLILGPLALTITMELLEMWTIHRGPAPLGRVEPRHAADTDADGDVDVATAPNAAVD